MKIFLIAFQLTSISFYCSAQQSKVDIRKSEAKIEERVTTTAVAMQEVSSRSKANSVGTPREEQVIELQVEASKTRTTVGSASAVRVQREPNQEDSRKKEVPE